MTTRKPAASATRKQSGFPPGQSGNPHGRKPGTRNRATILAEALLADELGTICRTVIRAAQGGDMMACRLILDRLLPARRGRPVALALPTVTTAGDVVAALAVVTAAVAAGELTADEGQSVAVLLEGQRRAIETADLARRIARLEGQREGNEGTDP